MPRVGRFQTEWLFFSRMNTPMWFDCSEECVFSVQFAVQLTNSENMPIWVVSSVHSIDPESISASSQLPDESEVECQLRVLGE